MAGTRSSARLKSSPQLEKSSAGTKRKADDSSPSTKSKRGRPSNDGEQKTLHETLPAAADQKDEAHDGVKDSSANGKDLKEHDETPAASGTVVNGKEGDVVKNGTDKESAFDHVKADDGEEGKTTTKEAEENKQNEQVEKGDVKADAIEEDKDREQAMPSNILEKGIIYFFTRGRVGVENPEKVQDLQRSYFVLRPLPAGAKLTDGAIQDVGNNRLIALPKKVWPKSAKDRFMVFVEKAKTSMEALKEEFFQGSDYTTQTVGTRHTPEVTPIGEGVYAITSTGDQGRGTTHLAYMLTIPSELGDVQKDVGLPEKGSFILSVKNPEASSGQASVQLPQAAEYPKEIVEEFGGRAWAPAEPKHIDYTNAAILIIGEDFERSTNLDATEADKNDDATKEPQEELEQLEKEDELRVENISGDDSIFADLGISSKEYPKVKTTW